MAVNDPDIGHGWGPFFFRPLGEPVPETRELEIHVILDAILRKDKKWLLSDDARDLAETLYRR